MERNLSGMTYQDSVEVAVKVAEEFTKSKKDQVRLILKALFEWYRYIDSESLKWLSKRLGLTHNYFQKAARAIPWLGLAYNGTKHYRMPVHGPTKRWSMCVYTPDDDASRRSMEEILENKGYCLKEGEAIPLPFEYVEYNGTVCWLEPCDSAGWTMEYRDHLSRQANLEEEQPEDHCKEWEEANYLLQVLLRSLEERCSKAERQMGRVVMARSHRDQGVSGVG